MSTNHTLFGVLGSDRYVGRFTVGLKVVRDSTSIFVCGRHFYLCEKTFIAKLNRSAVSWKQWNDKRFSELFVMLDSAAMVLVLKLLDRNTKQDVYHDTWAKDETEVLTFTISFESTSPCLEQSRLKTRCQTIEFSIRRIRTSFRQQI